MLKSNNSSSAIVISIKENLDMVMDRPEKVFKLSDSAIEELKQHKPGDKLFGKYLLTDNANFPNCLQIFQEFGSRLDFAFDNSAGVSVIFDPNKKTAKVSTFSYGGMAGLTFDETDRVAEAKTPDEMTVNYTLKLFKTLKNKDFFSETE